MNHDTELNAAKILSGAEGKCRVGNNSLQAHYFMNQLPHYTQSSHSFLIKTYIQRSRANLALLQLNIYHVLSRKSKIARIRQWGLEALSGYCDIKIGWLI